MTAAEGRGMEPRVSRLESFVEGLDEDIKSLSSTVDRMARDTQVSLQRQYDVIQRQADRFETAIGAVQTTISTSQKANWPLVLTACTVAILILTTIGGLAFQPMRESLFELRAEVSELKTVTSDNKVAIQSQKVQKVEIETQFRKERERVEAEMDSIEKVATLQHQLNRERIEHLRELLVLKGLPEVKAATP